MKKQVGDLQELVQQQADMVKNLHIIVHGDKNLGVQGLRESQRNSSVFREQVIESFREVRESINETKREIASEVEEKGKKITETLDDTLKPIIKNVNDLLDWKKAWNKTVEIITGSRTWRIVFLLIILLVSAGIFIKLKILGILEKW
jgi:hypothetical protein